MPESVSVTQANLVYFETGPLPQSLANRLVRLAAFQNPELYRAQAMRMPVWDKPRVIGCAENFPGLPRGCLEAVQQLLRDHGIRCDLQDERSAGEPLAVEFVGTLRPDQQAAAKAMLKHDTGVLCAPTAIGKTVTAAALIASRGVNTWSWSIAPSCSGNGRNGCSPFSALALMWWAPSAAARQDRPAGSTWR